jgi:hypothetical protein
MILERTSEDLPASKGKMPTKDSGKAKSSL